ncbi:hypothetical protein OpiT1DRAFT_03610 [Opitutaceae bacterium TAV1]|nr:hypothetical protein OpiT1DRAFT_03610 [Opitutaceae bacterium TAV1]
MRPRRHASGICIRSSSLVKPVQKKQGITACQTGDCDGNGIDYADGQGMNIRRSSLCILWIAVALVLSQARADVVETDRQTSPVLPGQMSLAATLSDSDTCLAKAGKCSKCAKAKSPPAALLLFAEAAPGRLFPDLACLGRLVFRTTETPALTLLAGRPIRGPPHMA